MVLTNITKMKISFLNLKIRMKKATVKAKCSQTKSLSRCTKSGFGAGDNMSFPNVDSIKAKHMYPMCIVGYELPEDLKPIKLSWCYISEVYLIDYNLLVLIFLL